MEERTFWIEPHENGIIGRFDNKIYFNPLTTIGDIIYELKDFRQPPIEYSYYDVIEEAAHNFSKVFQIPYANDKDYDKMRGNQRIPVEGEWHDYYEKILDIKEQIENNRVITLRELERLISYYNLTFTFDILKSEIIDVDNRSWTPLKFDFCEFDEAFEVKSTENSMEKATKDTKEKTDEKPRIQYHYKYNCYNMIDVPFAILHYLLLNDYKFRICEHCGKYFATKTLKQKYCNRKSPLREDLECDKAVVASLHYIRKRRNDIKKHLDSTYPSATNLFLDEIDKYLTDKKAEKNIEFLTMLTNMVKPEYVKKHWYIEKYHDTKKK